MGRAPCCSKVGLNRGPWSIKEDTILTTYIQEHGEGQWKSLPNNAGLLRCGKSCRLRWMNYLRPGIKRGNISQDEEDLIVRLHGLLGNRWSLIAGRLPGRTDNEIKNYWNTYIVKKLSNAGIKLKPNKNFRRLMESDKFVTSPASKESSAKIQETTKKICEEQNNCNDPAKTKVYRPKALRVSSMFSTTRSSVSRTSSNEDVQVARKVVDHATEEWPPRLEVKGANYGFFEAGDEDYFLGERFILQDSVSSTDDVKMWDKFYNEYLQLL